VCSRVTPGRVGVTSSSHTSSRKSLEKNKNMVVDPETKNYYAGEDQQQFPLQTKLPAAAHDGTSTKHFYSL
jgi:hypothetical protein